MVIGNFNSEKDYELEHYHYCNTCGNKELRVKGKIKYEYSWIGLIFFNKGGKSVKKYMFCTEECLTKKLFKEGE